MKKIRIMKLVSSIIFFVGLIYGSGCVCEAKCTLWTSDTSVYLDASNLYDEKTIDITLEGDVPGDIPDVVYWFSDEGYDKGFYCFFDSEYRSYDKLDGYINYITIPLTFEGASKAGPEQIVEIYATDEDFNVLASTKISVTVGPQYAVTYNANGGTSCPASQVKYYGNDIKLSSIKPERNGYIFKGWGISSTSTIPAYQPEAVYSKNENITLYAIWEKEPEKQPEKEPEKQKKQNVITLKNQVKNIPYNIKKYNLDKV